METLATLLALVGLAGFFGLSIWWAIRAGTKQREQVAARFRGAAESLGADFDPGEASFFRQRPPSLSLTAEGTRVLVDSYVVSSGKSSTTFSRVRCPWALQPGPALHVRKEHVFHGIGKALGMQDLVVGDASFDEAYVIKGPDPATLRRVVDADTRQALLFQLPRWELRADSEEVVMKRIGYTDSVQELVEVVRVALAVASADRRILMRFAKLTDAGVGSDGVSLRFDRSGVTGELRWGSAFRFVVPHRVEGPELSLACAEPGALQGLPEGVLPPPVAAALGDLGEAHLTRDGQHLWVSWPDVPEPAQVEAAWNVLVALAAPSTRGGAFR